MKMFNRVENYLDARKEYAYIFLRLVIGWRLIDGTEDNVFSWERMIEFRNFLAEHGVVYPLLAAVVSVYAQFIGGIMIMTGAYIRVAAAVMIINFLAALFIAHIGLSFEESFDALMMLFGSAFFFVAGAGKFSVDDLRRRWSSAPII
jgi:putative oxidoreductase